MPSIRLSKDERESLVAKLEEGHSLESGGAKLGLTKAQLGLAKDKYGVEMEEAFKTGTARIAAEITQTALTENNAAILLRCLEYREKLAEKSVDPITLVERVIVQAHCIHCGKYNTDVGSPILNADDKEPFTEIVTTT